MRSTTSWRASKHALSRRLDRLDRLEGANMRLAALGFLLMVFGCESSLSWTSVKETVRRDFPGVEHVSAEELNRRLESDAAPVLLDVREEAEYNVSHLPGCGTGPAGKRHVGAHRDARAGHADRHLLLRGLPVVRARTRVHRARVHQRQESRRVDLRVGKPGIPCGVRWRGSPRGAPVRRSLGDASPRRPARVRASSQVEAACYYELGKHG